MVPPVEVQRLADLVTCQAGAVVSKVLLKKKTGSVTLFGFSEGEGLSEHTTPYEALVYALEGDATIEIGQQPFEVKTGDVITLPADVPHAVHATSNFKMLLTMIRD